MMTHRAAFQMENLELAAPTTSTSVLLMQEALNRGIALYHFQATDLTLKNGKVLAHAALVESIGTEKGEFKTAPREWIDLATMNSVHIRQDPPFNMEYISATYFLEQLPQSVRVVNNPFWVRNSPEKLMTLLFPEFLPPTLITRDIDEIKAFTNGEMVIKPLYGHYGNDVFRFNESTVDTVVPEALKLRIEPWIVQPYLKAIETEGNTRALFIDGEYVGAFRIQPQEGEFLLYRGSRDVAHTLTPAETLICDAIGPVLKKRDLYYVGIDIIGDRLIEINVTSTGSMVKFREITGQRLEKKYWDGLA